MHYRHRPTMVEAVEFTPSNTAELRALLARGLNAHQYSVTPSHLMIETLEGDRDCPPGYWVLLDDMSEVYPVGPRRFARSYEPAENSGYLPRHASPAGAR